MFLKKIIKKQTTNWSIWNCQSDSLILPSIECDHYRKHSLDTQHPCITRVTSEFFHVQLAFSENSAMLRKILVISQFSAPTVIRNFFNWKWEALTSGQFAKSRNVNTFLNEILGNCSAKLEGSSTRSNWTLQYLAESYVYALLFIWDRKYLTMSENGDDWSMLFVSESNKSVNSLVSTMMMKSHVFSFLCAQSYIFSLTLSRWSM